MFRITQQSLQALGCLIIFFIKFQNLIFSKRCGFIILFILEIFQQLQALFLGFVSMNCISIESTAPEGLFVRKKILAHTAKPP